MCGANRARILHQHQHCLQMDRNEIPQDPRHLGVPAGASKTIFEPTVHLAQTVHLSCTNTNTISKWIETRFHMTHVTKEFHLVHPKLFPSLWYIRCKPCNYLAPRLHYLQMDRTELPLDPRHLGVPSGASKPIF